MLPNNSVSRACVWIEFVCMCAFVWLSKFVELFKAFNKCIFADYCHCCLCAFLPFIHNISSPDALYLNPLRLPYPVRSLSRPRPLTLSLSLHICIHASLYRFTFSSSFYCAVLFSEASGMKMNSLFSVSIKMLLCLRVFVSARIVAAAVDADAGACNKIVHVFIAICSFSLFFVRISPLGSSLSLSVDFFTYTPARSHTHTDAQKKRRRKTKQLHYKILFQWLEMLCVDTHGISNRRMADVLSMRNTDIMWCRKWARTLCKTPKLSVRDEILSPSSACSAPLPPPTLSSTFKLGSFSAFVSRSHLHAIVAVAVGGCAKCRLPLCARLASARARQQSRENARDTFHYANGSCTQKMAQN